MDCRHGGRRAAESAKVFEPIRCVPFLWIYPAVNTPLLLAADESIASCLRSSVSGHRYLYGESVMTEIENFVTVSIIRPMRELSALTRSMYFPPDFVAGALTKEKRMLSVSR